MPFKYPGITEIWRHFMLICWNWLWGGRTPSEQETDNTGNKGRRSCSKKKESQEQNIWKFSSAVFKKLSFTLKWFGTFKIKYFLNVFIGSLIQKRWWVLVQLTLNCVTWHVTCCDVTVCIYFCCLLCFWCKHTVQMMMMMMMKVSPVSWLTVAR